MRETTTFIKLDRNIVDWRWLGSPNTLAVWIYLLVTAKNEPEDFRDFTIGRGEVLVSYGKIADKLGMTPKEVRTAIEHLVKTGEIRKTRQAQNFAIYIIEGFSRYQDKRATFGQPSGNLSAISGQPSGNLMAGYKEDKEWEEEKKYKKYKNRGRAYAREAPKTGAALFEEIGEELRRQEAEEAKRNDAGGNE